MNVSFHIGAWFFPLLATIGIWIYALNLKPQGGFIDLSPFIFVAGASIATLLVWIGYLLYVVLGR
jgi:hypothetical protein